MTKIIQISDPHIVPDGQLAYGKVNTKEALISCVETINRIIPEIGPVDMVIVTGDLTDFGTCEEYEIFRDIMADLLIPYQAIPGNHDNVTEMRKSFSDQHWMPKSGPINWTVNFDQMAIIGLDTNVNGKPYGQLAETTLDYLKEKLKNLNQKPVIVAVHHPPIFTGIKKMDDNNLRESKRLKTLLSGYQGELKLVCGHLHRNISKKFGDVICQIAPGTSHAVSLDFRNNVPNCLIKEPSAFLIHEIRSGILTHNLFIGQFDGPHMFYPETG